MMYDPTAALLMGLHSSISCLHRQRPPHAMLVPSPSYSLSTLCHAVPHCATLATLCHAVPHCATLATVCHGVPRCATLCHAVPRCATLCHAVPRCAMLCHTVPRCATLCYCAQCCSKYYCNNFINYLLVWGDNLVIKNTILVNVVYYGSFRWVWGRMLAQR